MHYVYIVKCSDNTLYTGYTTDIRLRIRKHNGEITGGAKYTAGRGPVSLVYKEPFQSRAEAMKRESEIKSYTRAQKEELFTRD